MSTIVEILESEVLKLSAGERSHLLERLITSLDTDPEVEEAWAREADRREREIDSGEVEVIAGDEMMERLRARLIG